MSPSSPPFLTPRARVLHLTTAHQADDVRIFERECRSLAESGLYDVYLASPGAMPTGTSVVQIPLSAIPPNRLRRFLTSPIRAFSLCRTTQFDIWHLHDPELLPVALWLAWSGKRVIWDAHEDYLEQFTGDGAKAWVPSPLRRIVREGTSMLISAVDKRVSGVAAATHVIASRYNNPATVIVGNEVRADAFENCHPSFESRTLLFTGNPTPAHLFPEVVQAIVDLPDVSLAVAGRPPEPELWAKAEAALGSRLSHLGWLNRQQLAQAMDSAALGLLTYANTAPYSSGSPTKGYEFAAAGLPVVASPNMMNQELIARNRAGLIASGFDAANLREAISDALSDADRWRSASDAGRMWARSEGSWSASEARLLSLYGELLNT